MRRHALQVSAVQDLAAAAGVAGLASHWRRLTQRQHVETIGLAHPNSGQAKRQKVLCQPLAGPGPAPGVHRGRPVADHDRN